MKTYTFTDTQNHTHVHFKSVYKKNFIKSNAHEREITPTPDALVFNNKDICVVENTNRGTRL